MLNTSLGYHTFSFFQKLSWKYYNALIDDFNKLYRGGNGEIERCPIKDKKNPKKILGWEYFYKPSRGIRWRVRQIKISDTFTINGVMAVITPKVLIDNQFIATATENDATKVEELFNKEAARISPILAKFGECSTSRADPCLNIDLVELNYPCSPELTMKLIKRGNIPGHYKERKTYDEDAHRMKADDASFYLISGSANANFYLKSEQIANKIPTCPEKENARYLIKLEIQCKYPILYSLSKDTRHLSKFHVSNDDLSAEEIFWRMEQNIKNPSVPVDMVLTDGISEDIIRKYVYKIIRKGNYFTLDGARWMVERYEFRKEKKDRLVWVLELVNSCRGIAKAKATLSGTTLQDFKRSLNDLDAILVNPVTIPTKWGIDYIPNLLTAYYDSVYERVLDSREFLFRRYLQEYLSL